MRKGRGITGIGVPIGINEKMSGRLTLGMLARMEDARAQAIEEFEIKTDDEFGKIKQLLKKKAFLKEKSKTLQKEANKVSQFEMNKN